MTEAIKTKRKGRGKDKSKRNSGGGAPRKNIEDKVTGYNVKLTPGYKEKINQLYGSIGKALKHFIPKIVLLFN